MLFGGRTSEDETVVTMLASAIRRDISFGVLRPDQKLKLEALRQSYGGSNHSMRETLRILTSEGLVEATNWRGFRVTSATDGDLRDILLMRLEVEKLALTRSRRGMGIGRDCSTSRAKPGRSCGHGYARRCHGAGLGRGLPHPDAGFGVGQQLAAAQRHGRSILQPKPPVSVGIAA